MRFTARHAILFLTCSPFSATAAQQWVADSGVVRLAWGSVNVLVRADTVAGLGIWAQTSTLGFGGEPHEFNAQFDPQTLEPWLDRANLVANYKGGPSADSAIALETPALTATDGSQIVMLRRRHRHEWEATITILFQGSGSSPPWSIPANRKEAGAFLTALFHQTFKSRLQPGLVTKVAYNVEDLDEMPAPMAGNPSPTFPPTLRRAGEVWVTFVIRADGTADPGSFHALLFDDPAFVDSAVYMILHSRYRPGVRHGQPVPVLTLQRVIFRS